MKFFRLPLRKNNSLRPCSQPFQKNHILGSSALGSSKLIPVPQGALRPRGETFGWPVPERQTWPGTGYTQRRVGNMPNTGTGFISARNNPPFPGTGGLYSTFSAIGSALQEPLTCRTSARILTGKPRRRPSRAGAPRFHEAPALCAQPALRRPRRGLADTSSTGSGAGCASAAALRPRLPRPMLRAMVLRAME